MEAGAAMNIEKEVRYYHFIFQPLMAGIFIWCVLLGLDQVSNPGLLWAVGASSIASSTFIVFTRPGVCVSDPLKLLGAYLISILIGIVCAHLDLWLKHVFSSIRALEIATAVSIMFAIGLMTVLNFEHPPAAGMALVLVLEPWGFATVIIIVLAVIVLIGLGRLFHPFMVDLWKCKKLIKD